MMEIKRSLYKRVVPVRVRHHLSLILGSIILLVLVGGFLGSFPLQPIVFSNGSPTLVSSVVNNIEGTVDFFDLTQPHSITFEMNDYEYDHMISEFKEFGEKAWVQVDAVIDGTAIPSVGIRLKGNSTLGSLGGGGDAFSQDKLLGDFDIPEGVEMGMNSNVTFDDPSSLPLLISFDEFVPGRGYQGKAELALRYGDTGVGNLNEAVALQLIEDSGQVSQKYTWVTYSINGSETISRIVLENPDQNYVSTLGLGPGVMYKSRSSNEFVYHGEDQTQYSEDFMQLNAFGSQDLSPVIDFMGWLDAASDEEFDTELADRLDVPSFAKYVVTHDLLNNFDDMAGPGRNFLFWYDLDDKKFTVITWDLNLAITGPSGGMGAFLPEGMDFAEVMKKISSGEMEFATLMTTIAEGMMASAGEGGPPEGFPAPPEGTDMAAMAEAMANGEGPPAGFPGPPPGMDMAAMMGGEGGPPPAFAGITFGNSLKDRFTASDAFAEEIASARLELLALWFESGRAQELINSLSEYIPVSEKLSEEQIQTEVASLTEAIAKVK